MEKKVVLTLKKYFLFFSSIVLNLFMLAYAKVMIERVWMEGRENVINALMFCMGTSSDCWMGLLFPVTAVISYATIYVRERKTGYYTCCVLRKSKKKYACHKFVCAALCGGVSLAFPVSLMGVFLYYTLDPTASLYDINHYTTTSFYTDLAEHNVIAYMIMTVVIVFVCGAVFSVFALGISTLVKNEFLTIIIPFAISILSAIFFDRYNLLLTFCPSEYDGISIWNILLMDIFLFGIGTLLWVKEMKYSEEI